MASKKITKQEMREDQFRDILSEFYFGSLSHVERHWAAYAVGLVIFLLAFAGGYYLWQQREANREQASYLVGEVIEAFNAPVEPAKSGGEGQLSFTTDALRTQEVDTRIAALRRTKAPGTGDDYAVFYVALGQARAGKLTDAVGTLTPITAGSELAPVALCLRARLYEAGGQNDKAEADLKKVAGLDTQALAKGEGWWLLGQFYERRGQKDKAADAYEKAQKAAASQPKPDATKKPPAPPAPAGPGQGKTDEDPIAKRAKDQLEALKGKA